jgi:hypothetical protein
MKEKPVDASPEGECAESFGSSRREGKSSLEEEQVERPDDRPFVRKG